MRKITSFLKRHQIVSTIIVAVIGNLVWAIFQTALNKINFFEAILDIPMTIVRFTWGLLAANIPIWLVILIISVVVFGFWLYSRLHNTTSSNGQVQDYNTDIYKNQKYRWRWDDNCMAGLTPICNDCDGNLVYDNLDGYSAWLLCPNCDKRYPRIDRTTAAHAETFFVNKANNGLKKNN